MTDTIEESPEQPDTYLASTVHKFLDELEGVIKEEERLLEKHSWAKCQNSMLLRIVENFRGGGCEQP